jgi:hypothetical protein
MEPSGYPVIVLYGVLSIGLFLVIFRPYWAFLFAVILYSALDPFLAVKTRTFLGEYFNLFDATLLIALLAILVENKGVIKIPTPVILIFSVLAIGEFHTLAIHKVNYDVLRSLRWALDFPMGILIGANMIKDPKRVQSYLYAAIIGAFLGSLSSFLVYKSAYAVQAAMGMDAPRDMYAERGLGTYLLVAAICHPFFKDRSNLVKWLWRVALIFYGAAILFGQWRAVYLAVVITPFLLTFLIGNWRIYGRSIIIFAVLLPVVLVFLMVALPKISPTSYFDRLAGVETLDPNYATNLSRKRQIIMDLTEWSEGNWLIGRGLNYSAFLKPSERKGAARGHVGYTNYLATMGLLGLFVYGFYVPWVIFKASKRLYNRQDNWALVCLGILGAAAVIMETIIAFMSTSYLLAWKENVGFLFGAVWMLARTATAPQAIPASTIGGPVTENLKVIP